MVGHYSFPIWPGLDRSRELEEFRIESLRRSQESRQRLMRILNEEVDLTEQAWQRVNGQQGLYEWHEERRRRP